MNSPVATRVNHQVRLASRPVGLPTAANWQFTEEPVVEPGAGGVLVQTLAEHNLIDEYHLLVYPLVLGSGKRIFPAGLRVNLRLLEAQPLPTGVVVMRYAPAQEA